MLWYGSQQGRIGAVVLGCATEGEVLQMSISCRSFSVKRHMYDQVEKLPSVLHHTYPNVICVKRMQQASSCSNNIFTNKAKGLSMQYHCMNPHTYHAGLILVILTFQEKSIFGK